MLLCPFFFIHQSRIRISMFRPSKQQQWSSSVPSLFDNVWIPSWKKVRPSACLCTSVHLPSVYLCPAVHLPSACLCSSVHVFTSAHLRYAYLCPTNVSNNSGAHRYRCISTMTGPITRNVLPSAHLCIPSDRAGSNRFFQYLDLKWSSLASGDLQKIEATEKQD